MSEIDINQCTLKELDTLEGIGESRAKKIISSRPYSSTTDLVKRKILTQNLFDKIKTKIKV